jgi:hypothetical protein
VVLDLRCAESARAPSDDDGRRRRRTTEDGMMSETDAVVSALARASERVEESCANAVGTPLDFKSILERARTAASSSKPGGDKRVMRDALGSVKRAWYATTAEPMNRLTERELAVVMRTFNEAWLQHGLEGTPLDDGTWAFRVSKINYPNAKKVMTELAAWLRKGEWTPWVEMCRKIRDDLTKKSEGPFNTYAQLLRALDALRAQATTGVRNLVNNGDSKVTYEDAMEYDRELKAWIESCWSANGLPPLDDVPQGNVTFHAAGMEPIVVASSKRAPPRDRSQPVSPVPPPPKKPKATPSKVPAVAVATPKEQEDAAPTKLAARDVEMHVVRHSVAVQVKAKCYGLDAELVIIPPFGLPDGLKTNGEVAAMVFKETQLAQQSNTQAAEPSSRCVHNDGKAWRCPGRRVEESAFCGKHKPKSFATTARVEPVRFETTQGLIMTYTGAPSACVIRSVAGASIDASDLLMLKDPENFEQHAWEVETKLKSCEGLVRKDGPGGRFRENAVVLERGGIWVPYAQYEAKLLTMLPGTPSGANVASESVFNQCIEDIRAINAKRVIQVERAGVKEEEQSEPTSEPEIQEAQPGAEGEQPKIPTGAQEVRKRLAELHRQLNGVTREITAMQDTGIEHAKQHDRQQGEGEYDAYEHAILRALRKEKRVIV